MKYKISYGYEYGKSPIASEFMLSYFGFPEPENKQYSYSDSSLYFAVAGLLLIIYAIYRTRK